MALVSIVNYGGGVVEVDVGRLLRYYLSIVVIQS